MTHCEREKEIDELKKAIYGNGQPGLKETVIRIDENLKSLNTHTEKIGTVLSGLLKFQNEVDGMGKSKTTIQWLIAISLGLFATNVTLLISIFKT